MKSRRQQLSFGEGGGAYELPEPLWELLDAMYRLPRKQRAALVLHYYGGYTTKEAAAILGSTSATVRVHLSRGRKRLREQLERVEDV